MLAHFEQRGDIHQTLDGIYERMLTKVNNFFLDISAIKRNCAGLSVIAKVTGEEKFIGTAAAKVEALGAKEMLEAQYKELEQGYCTIDYYNQHIVSLLNEAQLSCQNSTDQSITIRLTKIMDLSRQLHPEDSKKYVEATLLPFVNKAIKKADDGISQRAYFHLLKRIKYAVEANHSQFWNAIQPAWAGAVLGNKFIPKRIYSIYQLVGHIGQINFQEDYKAIFDKIDALVSAHIDNHRTQPGFFKKENVLEDFYLGIKGLALDPQIVLKLAIPKNKKELLCQLLAFGKKERVKAFNVLKEREIARRVFP